MTGCPIGVPMNRCIARPALRACACAHAIGPPAAGRRMRARCATMRTGAARLGMRCAPRSVDQLTRNADLTHPATRCLPMPLQLQLPDREAQGRRRGAPTSTVRMRAAPSRPWMPIGTPPSASAPQGSRCKSQVRSMLNSCAVGPRQSIAVLTQSSGACATRVRPRPAMNRGARRKSAHSSSAALSTMSREKRHDFADPSAAACSVQSAHADPHVRRPGSGRHLPGCDTPVYVPV
jgi:hypothetical protein